ncbi:RluA family pseudouridine synthase [Acetobacter sp.]|uniref:RluA family pseudouridine synthase n=1 Tax=Acetobacter sp. TaxID=440 RepID=UPI0039E7B941
MPPLPFETLYESNRLLVINKPAGLAVHPGPRGGPSVEDWFPLMTRRKDGPWLAHRLDADTAGCLAIALRKQALLEAQNCFAAGKATKIYWAIVRGAPPDTLEIDQPLKKVSSAASGWHMHAAADGLPARTSLRVMGSHGGFAWVELTLHSGRTHQARVHCAEAGFPILGDPVYAPPGADTSLHLLSRKLVLPLPEQTVSAVAPPPPHMMAALRACGYTPSADL